MEVMKYNDIVDGTVVETCTGYIIVFDDTEKARKAREQHPSLFTCRDGEWIGIFNAGNSVGTVVFMGKQLTVRCKSKLTESEFDCMVTDIVEKMALLPFDFNTNSVVTVESTDIQSSEILYHAFLVVRYWLKQPELRLMGAIEAIKRDPLRKESLAVRTQDVWQLSKVSTTILTSLITNIGTAVRLPEYHKLQQTGLGRHLLDAKNDMMFPVKVQDTVILRTLDTTENRFVRYVLEMCQEVLYRFIKALNSKGNVLNKQQLIGEANEMIQQLEQQLHSEFIQEIGVMSALPFQSIALQRRSGYKEVLDLYRALIGAFYQPLDNRSLHQAIEQKDIAKLYEVWTYFKTLQAIEDEFALKPKQAWVTQTDPFRHTLGNGISTVYELDGKPLIVAYNRSFSGNKQIQSYSLPYRPDIVIEFCGDLYVFDAKFKLRFLSSVMEDAEQYEIEDLGVKDAFTFKKEDIHKMHAYKDGIQSVRLACILYPGTNSDELCFYEQGDARTGVGAIPLRPNSSLVAFKDFLRRILRIKS